MRAPKDPRHVGEYQLPRESLSFIERHAAQIDKPYMHRARSQILLGKLGLSDRDALAIARDPSAHAAVWFGLGFVAGTLVTALVVAGARST